MILGMIIGVVILLLGVLIGRVWARAVYSSSKKAIGGEPQPICGCKHHYSFHDVDGGCHYVMDWHWEGKKHIDELCGCKRYTGPEPLPTYTAEIGP